ncbi:MAG: AsmA family protein [Magnetococcales bacterium]|nr:AsmA family protein [Magnetococcales bacterium]
MKPLKLLMKLFLVVVVFAMAVAVGITAFIDPNDYRDEMARLVREHTGRELRLGEGLHVSLFPWIGIRATDVALGNAPGFGTEPFAQVSSLEVRVRLEPLLRRQVAVDTVVVKGLVLNLARNAEGVGNWEDLGRSDDAVSRNAPGNAPDGNDGKREETHQTTDAASRTPSLMAAVMFQGIEVEKGKAVWHDARSGDGMTLENLDLVVGRMVPGEPVAMEFHSDLLPAKGERAGQLGFKGQIKIKPEQGVAEGIVERLSFALADRGGTNEGVSMALAGGLSVRLADMATGITLDKGEIKASESFTGGAALQANFKGGVDFDPGQRTVRLKLQQVGLEAGGERLAGIKVHAGMDVDGQVDLATRMVVATMAGLNVEAREGTLKDGFLRLEAPGRLRADLNRGDAEIALAEMSLKGEGAVFSGGGFTGRMDALFRVDWQRDRLETVLDKAILEMTGGAFQTGGGELRFHAETLLAMKTGALEGNLSGFSFSVHGPMVDNGRVETTGSIAWNMKEGGAGPLVMDLSGMTLRVRDGFLGANGQSTMRCQARMTMPAGGDTLQGVFRECSVDARGPVVGGGRLSGRLAGSLATHLKGGTVLLKPFEVSLKNTEGTAVAGIESIDGTFELTVDPQRRHYAADFSRLSLQTRDKSLGGGLGRLDLTGRVEADLKNGEVSTQATRLEITIAGGVAGKGRVQVAGPVQISTLLDGPQVRTTLKDLALSYQDEDAGGGTLAGTLSGGVAVDLKKGTVDLSGIDVLLAGARMNAEMKVAGIGKHPTWDGTWRIHEFNLAELLAKLHRQPPRTRDPRALRKVSLAASVKGAGDHLTLDAMELLLDESRMTGTMGILRFAPLALVFDLNVDGIDLDRYRDPEEKAVVERKEAKGFPGDKGNTAAARKSVVAAPGTSGETMGLPDMKGTLRLGRLKAFDVRLTDAVMTLTADKGVLRVHPLVAKLYQGTVKVDIDADFRVAEPKTVVKAALDSVQGGPFLADVTGVDRIVGKADGSADLAFRGLEANAIKRSLNGKVRFEFGDGAIKGINIARMIRTAYQVVKGMPPESDAKAEQTDFSEFSATVNWNNGVATNDDLNLKSPLLRVGGEGQADLPKDSVNYRIRAAVVGSLVGQGGKPIGELDNITVPIRVSGTPTHPRYQVDLKGLIKENVKEEAKQKIIEKIEKKLEKKMDDGLREKLQEKGLDRVLEQVVPKGLDGLLNKIPF